MLQIAASAGRTLVKDATLFKGIVQESGLYSQVQTGLVAQLAESFQGAEVELTEAEVATLIDKILPATRMQRLTDGMVDGLHGWFWSDEERPTILLDLSEVRAAFPGALRPLIIAKIEALPACSAARGAQLAASYNGGMLPCKPSDAAFNQRVVESITAELALEEFLPERIDLTAQLEEANGSDFWAEMREGFEEARSLLDMVPFGWGVIGLLIGLLALLNLDRWYTPFGWVAATLLIGGGLALFGGMLGTGVAQSMIQEAISSGDEAMQVMGLAQLGMERLFSLMRQMGLTAAAIGLVCMGIAMIGRRTQSVRPLLS